MRTLIGTIALATLLVPRGASAYAPVIMGGGPVLSPDIVPLYWGSWTPSSGTPTDPFKIDGYIDGFAAYLSGAPATAAAYIAGGTAVDSNPPQPIGGEPVTKQYGVWGATRISGASIGTCTNGQCDTHIRNAGVQNRIHLLQSQGLLPPNSPNRVFLVLLKGFTYDFTDASGVDSSDCAYHSLNNGTYYAVVPWDGIPCGVNNSQFQRSITHELMEAMTDPYPFNGWVTNGGTLGLSHSEGGDQCVNSSTAFGFGTVQTFADNSVAGCTTWKKSTTSPLGVSHTASTILDVFFPTPSPLSLRHATLSTASGFYQWSAETMVKVGTTPRERRAVFVGAPSAVNASPNQLDVFVRGSDGLLRHASRAGTGAWTWSNLNSPSAVGQPSAVSWGPQRIDVVVQNIDSSVGHLWTNDTVSFFSETFASQTIGPPTIISRGINLLDIFTFGAHADLVEDSYNAGWSGFHTLVGGSNDNSLRPPGVVSWDLQHKDVYTNGLSWNVAQSPVRTRWTSSSGWQNSWSPIAVSSTTDGALDAAADFGEYDFAWKDFATDSYKDVHYFSDGTLSVMANLGGLYATPPRVAYGSDGFPYILGIGGDGCLYYTWLDWWTGGPVVNGPYSTGVAYTPGRSC